MAEGLPADLAGVMDAWPSLPEAVKAGILAIVRASVQGRVTSRAGQGSEAV